MKVLFVRWHSFMRWGIERAFEELGISYEVLDYDFTDWERDEVFCVLLSDRLKKSGYDVVFSVNFMPLVSGICQDMEIKYYSWVYDNPLHIRNLTPLLNDCNEIFFFDRMQALEYEKCGVNSHHLMLAASPEIFDEVILGKTVVRNREKYMADVSMVGQLYNTSYDLLSRPLEPYLQGYIEGIMAAQSKLYGAYIIPELAQNDLVEAMNKCYRTSFDGFKIEQRELIYMLACEVTNRERKDVLTLLAQDYDTVLYSMDKVENIKGLRYGGYIDYVTVMPQVFADSKINLNVSLKTIQSGIPLRVLDIMACGGFVLSNYQPEIAECLRPGEACAVYESLDDMYDKAHYYMEHDEERMRIARAGRELVMQEFRFEDRIKSMFDSCD